MCHTHGFVPCIHAKRYQIEEKKAIVCLIKAVYICTRHDSHASLAIAAARDADAAESVRVTAHRTVTGNLEFHQAIAW